MDNWFTTDNTEGYTAAELATFNAELATLLEGVDDADERWDICKAFESDVAGR